MEIDINGNKIGTGSINNNFTYIIIPLMGKRSFGKKVKLFLAAGVYGGYLLSAYSQSKFKSSPER